MTDWDGASDAQLLVASREEPDAFAELFDRHFERTLAFFYTRTFDPQTAADLASETFAEAFSSRRNFDDVGAPGTAWLMTIAHRQLNRWIRRQKVDERARRKLGIGMVDVDRTSAERIERLVDLEPLRQTLKAALDRIPASQATAVQLRVTEGLPYEEVARRLDCTQTAARARVSRGLRSLSDLLEEPA